MGNPGPIRQILRIALLALVLAAQTVAHVHAADHGSPAGKTKCPVCSVAQPNGNAAIDCSRDAAVAPPVPPQFAPAATPAGEPAAPALHARAPPHPH